MRWSPFFDAGVLRSIVAGDASPGEPCCTCYSQYCTVENVEALDPLEVVRLALLKKAMVQSVHHGQSSRVEVLLFENSLHTMKLTYLEGTGVTLDIVICPC